MKMKITEAFDVLKREGLTTHIETVRTWIRQGKLRATLPSRREGYQIERDDLLGFMRTKLSAKDWERVSKELEQEYPQEYETDIEQLRLLKAIQDLKHLAQKHNKPRIEAYADLSFEDLFRGEGNNHANHNKEAESNRTKV